MLDILKKIIREPLTHFLLLGSLIFAGYSLLATQVPSTDNIFITKDEINSIENGFARTRQRLPTTEELEGLIRERIRQEVYRREAVALGLDKDDIIIQRRLQQKLEFIIGDNVVAVTPTDVELQDFLNKHPGLFKVEPQFTFKQVFLDPDKRGSSIEKNAISILAILNNRDVGYKELSDPTLLPFELLAARSTEVSGVFGNQFSLELSKLPIGKWAGPVKSTYGLHLIQLRDRQESSLPALSDVRDEVIREWNNFRILDANEKIYQKLLKNYKVTIEK